MRRRLLLHEMLERRNLLAADLSVELDGDTSFVPGEPSSLIVRVTNPSSEAVEATVSTNAGDALDDIAWSRKTEIQKQVSASDLSQLGPKFDVSDDWPTISPHSKSIGDLNGDGIDDLIVMKRASFGSVTFRRVHRPWATGSTR